MSRRIERPTASTSSVPREALTGCIVGSGVRTWRQEQQKVKQKPDGELTPKGVQAQSPWWSYTECSRREPLGTPLAPFEEALAGTGTQAQWGYEPV
jgi:hypothetical protein